MDPADYRFRSTERERFSLHDCRAKRAERTGERLTFFFPDGIWCRDRGEDWPNTGPAAVTFSLDRLGETTVYLFEQTAAGDLRRELPLAELLERINTGAWELEFGYRYDRYREVLVTGWVWQDREPWSRECQLFLPTREPTEYWWNE